VARQAPAPPERPAPIHRSDLSGEQRERIETATRDAGVEVAPWLAWAASAALTRGPEVATAAAILGAAFEPYWTPQPSDSIELPPPRRWPVVRRWRR
jgi:hypothetical protein